MRSNAYQQIDKAINEEYHEGLGNFLGFNKYSLSQRDGSYDKYEPEYFRVYH